MRPFMLLASILAIASTVLAQNAAAVVDYTYIVGNDTILLNSDILNVNNTVQGLPWALQVQVDSVNIYRTLKNATYAAQTSANFSEDDSFLVANTLVNITTYVKQSLNSSSSKVSAFGELAPIVLATLYQLKSASDVFANATIAKLSASYQGVAPSVKGQLDTSFNDAIAAYGGKPLAG